MSLPGQVIAPPGPRATFACLATALPDPRATFACLATRALPGKYAEIAGRPVPVRTAATGGRREAVVVHGRANVAADAKPTNYGHADSQIRGWRDQHGLLDGPGPLPAIAHQGVLIAVTVPRASLVSTPAARPCSPAAATLIMSV